MLACIRFGAPFVLLERFDPEALLDAIKVHRCTWVIAVHVCGAAAMPAGTPSQGRFIMDLSCGWRRLCTATAREFPSFFEVPLRSFWASTEACGSLTYGLQPGPVSRIAPDGGKRR